MKKHFIILLSLTFLFISCKQNYTKKELIIKPTDFSNPIEVKLAKAIIREDIKTINKICSKNPQLITETFTEHKYSVIHWTTEICCVNSLKALLSNGMNPNAITGNGETPLYRAIASFAIFPPRDITEVVEILIDNGADCNFKKIYGKGLIDLDCENETPFIKAVTYHYLDIAEIMIQKGNADINAKTKTGITATIKSLWYKDIESAHYMICKNKANIKDGFYYNKNETSNIIYPVTLLRSMIYPLDSEQYQMKLEIIEEFKRQGIDYYAEPIPDDVMKLIKNKYPDNWEEYAKVY